MEEMDSREGEATPAPTREQTAQRGRRIKWGELGSPNPRESIPDHLAIGRSARVVRRRERTEDLVRPGPGAGGGIAALPVRDPGPFGTGARASANRERRLG